MKVLVLLASIGVLAQARPEAGYSYSTPSNTYGAPGGGFATGGAAPVSGIGLSGGSFAGAAGGIGIGSGVEGIGTSGAGVAFGSGTVGSGGGGFGGGAGGGYPAGGPAAGFSTGFGVSTGGGYATGGSLIQKHIYVHVPPPEPEEHIAQRLPQFRPAQKHYKIVFIKAPTPPTPTAANIQLPGQDEQKTLIYVLVKKPDEAEALNIQQPAPTQPSKPEVYFIKYKTQKQVTSGGAIGVGGGISEAVTGGAGISTGVHAAGTGGAGISGGTGVSSSYGPPGASGPY